MKRLLKPLADGLARILVLPAVGLYDLVSLAAT
jgi:hypothetical protein